MTALERKLAQQCRRCPARSLDDHGLCSSCRDKQNDHNRRCMAQLRELRRDNGLCADCGRESQTYRCAAGCSTLGAPLASAL